MENEQKYINPDSLVYISLTRKDKAVADTLCELLRRKFIDYRIYTEEDIQSINEFEQEIGSSKIVVIIYSIEYFKKTHCMNEYALIRKKEEGKRIYTVKCGKFDFKEKTEELMRFWAGEKIMHPSKNYSTFTLVDRMAFDNAFYIDEGTKYSVQMLEQFERDHPYYDETYLDALTNNIEQYISNYCIQSGNSHTTFEHYSKLPSLYFNTRMEHQIVPRDNEIKEIKKMLQYEQFVNVTGMGGCGKTTISEYFVIKYKNDYNQIAGTFINGDYYQDIIKAFNNFFHTTSYNAIISELDKYPRLDGKTNLFILDINETADYLQIENALDELRQNNRLSNWKMLIVSREKIHSNIVEFKPLNAMLVDNKILQNIFFHYLDQTKHSYYEFTTNDFNKLFCVLFFLPLLVEQLAYFLNKVDKNTLKDIFEYLGVDESILNSELAEEKLISRVRIGRKIDYTTVGNYLSKLMIFSKLDVNQQSGTLQREITRHLMMWPTDYYSPNFIRLLILNGNQNEFSKKTEWKIQKSLETLVEKHVFDTQQDSFHRIKYKIHSLIADTFRRQVFEDNDNGEFRNYDIFLDNITKSIKDYKYIYDSWLDNNPEYTNNIETYKYGVNDPIIDDLIRQMIFVEGIGRQFHSFYIEQTPVKQCLWEAVMGKNNNPSVFKLGDDYPIENVSWEDCLKFIIKLNKITKLKFRFPYEIEWDYAAHGGNKHENYYYSGSNCIDDVAQYNNRKTCPVGIFKPNGLDIYDMTGNVWEWCQIRRGVSISTTNTTSSFVTTNDESYILRGGSYMNKADCCRIKNRCEFKQGYNYDGIGLRLVLSANNKTTEL